MNLLLRQIKIKIILNKKHVFVLFLLRNCLYHNVNSVEFARIYLNPSYPDLISHLITAIG